MEVLEDEKPWSEVETRKRVIQNQRPLVTGGGGGEGVTESGRHFF